jgi:site-specific DNA recombinase
MDKKAVIYLRVSTLDQDYERQRIELHKLAEALGYTIIATYEEKKSAVKKMETREELTKMRELTKQDVDTIFVWDITRLSRNTLDFINLVNEFAVKGINIYFKERNIQTLESNGKIDPIMQMFLYMSGVFAQMEAEGFKARTKSGTLQKKQTGEIAYTSTAPFGYKLVNKKLVIDETKADTVKYIFDTYIADKKGLNALQMKLKAAGKGIFYVTGLYRIITNKVYYGGHEYTPAIISKEIFDAANSLLKSNKTITDKSRKKEGILRGLLKCGECGGEYIYKIGNNGKERYMCNDNRRDKLHRKGCKNVSMYSEDVDTIIWETIKQAVVQKHFIDKFNADKEELKIKYNDNISLIEGINKEIEVQNRKLKRAFDIYCDEAISLRFDTCIRLRRRLPTVRFSSSLAGLFFPGTCTVISGIEMSGSSDTGTFIYVIMPRIKNAVKDIKTAIGLSIRNLIIRD